jgi:hypothetical protein
MLIKVPDNHRIGTRVPEGGSSCASCKYLQKQNHCGNKYWLAWHKDPLIPEPADSYCCDFYEEARAG